MPHARLEGSACARYVYRSAPEQIHRILESPWVSPHIVPATSDASARTDFAPGWPRGGDVKFSAAGARRDASASRCNCHPSTPESESPTPGGGGRRKFSRRHRLTRGAELEAVSRGGKRFRFSHLEVRCVPAESGTSRIGFIVPKHGQTVIRRNRLKRRLREWARLGLLPKLGDAGGRAVDIVVRARNSAYEAPELALREEFDQMISSVVRFAAARS